MTSRIPFSARAALGLLLLTTAVPLVGATPTSIAPRPVSAVSGGRLVVLGFDGADANITEKLMDQGQLPHLASLRAQGTFAPLATTMPAESPVSWASLNSGQNPAKTGIPGFVKRDLTDGVPGPTLGHLAHESRRSDSFALGPLAHVLVAHDPLVVGIGAGAIAFVLFFVVFAWLLKIRKHIAVLLALLLGAIGGFGGFVSSGYVPRTISDVVANPTKTAGFWEVAAQKGVPCVVIDGAMSWDRPAVPNLKLLAGLGVPDVRAANGDWFVYTTDENLFMRAPEGRPTSTGGKVFRVDEHDGRIDSFVYGPIDYWKIERLKAELRAIEVDLGRPGVGDAQVDKLTARKTAILAHDLPLLECRYPFGRTEEGRVSVPLVVEKKDGKAIVTIGGQAQEIAPGAWSGWYRLTFEINPLFKVKAITRCKLVTLAEPFELYVDFLQIDPADPIYWQPVSTPRNFAAELAKSIGMPYETVGWACMTMPFKDRKIDPVTFLEDIEFTHGWREKLLLAALARDDWRVLMDVESTPDRVQHMMFQYYDEGHPAYDAAKAKAKTRYFGHEIELADAIPATYREMDKLVGEVVERLKPDDTLLVCADHGFQTFRRQVDLNAWLVHEGYAVLREGCTYADGSAFPAWIDWSKSRAYALGLGMIFLNLEGREHDGIVAANDAPALLEEIRAKLLQLKDPGVKSGPNKAVHDVYVMSKIHSGPYLSAESDLMVGFEAGWRVSWETTLGSIGLVESADKESYVAGDVCSDNKLNWSGDHVSVAADLVPGVFFSNRKVAIPAGGLNLLHIAPTALDVVGVAVPKEYDLTPLKFLP